MIVDDMSETASETVNDEKESGRRALRRSACAVAAEQRQIGVDHHRDQLLETEERLPTQGANRLRRIGEQQIDLRRAMKLGIDDHVISPIQADVTERNPHELLDAVRFARA